MAERSFVEEVKKLRLGAGEVFRAFLALGSTAFGGPIAHIGYLRQAFVLRRRWLDESRFAQLLAVCQFLPGPASSQLALAIGLQRDGGRGALQAFAGFTLPEVAEMLGISQSTAEADWTYAKAWLKREMEKG